MKLYEMTAGQLGRLMQKREASAVEVLRSFRDRIEMLEPTVKAFITYTPGEAMRAASEVDRMRAAGEELHPLAGVPVAVKDNICTAGVLTTCASRMLESFVPPYDATVIARIKKAGMPIIGKTNMDEFAMGSSTENSAFFPTHNPWDLERVPGGSSGGSAAAVAAGFAPLALGTDTGGSVRQPAAYCGLAGLRPTYGRVSRYGLVGFAPSLDQAGILSLDAAGAALLTGLIAGGDPMDATCFTEPVPDYVGLLAHKEIAGLRVGLLTRNTGEGFDPEVTGAVKKIAGILADNGAVVEEAALPHSRYALAAYHVIASCEAASNLARYDGVRYGFSAGGKTMTAMLTGTRGAGFAPEVKRRIITGAYAMGPGCFDRYYLQAMKVRALIRRDYDRVFSRFDLLLGAATPTPAFRLGEKSGDSMEMCHTDVCTTGDAMAGMPSLSVPCGLHSGGLPVGVLLTAPPLREDLLLQVAHFMEQAREPFPHRPDPQAD